MVIEKTVILIDDDKDDLELLQEALKAVDADHSIIEAYDGLEAMATLTKLLEQKRLPCLIVLDVNMPKMDGKQAFIAIKSDTSLSKIPVVVFSTSTSLLDRTFFERHKTAYLVKPFSFTELARTASRMINLCHHKSNK